MNMLYMMFDKNNCMVKIGYTSNIEGRKRYYKTHNPSAEMRWKCSGETTQEKKAREDLAQIANTRVGRTEWFEVSDSVYEMLYQSGFECINSRKKVINRFA